MGYDRIDDKGREILDDTPVSIPLRFTRQSKYNDTIRAIIKAELSLAAENVGYESFEEADDFDVGDDFDPKSQYEIEFEGLPVAELRRLKLQDDEAKGSSSSEPVADKVSGEDGGGGGPSKTKAPPPSALSRGTLT